jgi:hypothetical protein
MTREYIPSGTEPISLGVEAKDKVEVKAEVKLAP